MVEPLRTALWNEHSISLLLPLGSPPPVPAPGSASYSQQPQQPRNNPEDPEATAATSHELAGSSPFSGQGAADVEACSWQQKGEVS